MDPDHGPGQVRHLLYNALGGGALGALFFLAERPSRTAWLVGMFAGAAYALGIMAFPHNSGDGRLSAKRSLELGAVAGSLGGLAFTFLDRSFLGYLAAMLLVCGAVLLVLAIGFRIAQGVGRSRLRGSAPPDG